MYITLLQIHPMLSYRLKDFNLGMDFLGILYIIKKPRADRSGRLGRRLPRRSRSTSPSALPSPASTSWHFLLECRFLAYPTDYSRANQVMLLSVAEPSLAEAADIAAHETRRGETVSTSSHSDEEGRTNTRMISTAPPSFD